MKNCYLSFIVFLLYFTLGGCKVKKDQQPIDVIEVDVTSENEMKLSDFFENFRVVKLETSDNCLIGEIKRIRQSDQKIYITDGRSIFVFSNTGSLLSTFNKTGKGPDEYQNITDFVIDGADIVILSKANRKLLKYNDVGNKMSECGIEYWAQSVSPPINNQYILYSGNELGFGNKYKLHIESDCRHISQSLLIDDNKAKYLHINSLSNFFKYNDQVRFFEPFNDVIYTISNNELHATWHIDYKGKNIPGSFFDTKYKFIYEMFQDVHKTSYAYGIVDFVENDRKMIFGSYYQKNKKLTIFDKQNKTTQTFSTIQDDILCNSMVINASDFTYFADEHIILPVDAPVILEWKNQHDLDGIYKNILQLTKEKDNPIMLIFDLKFQ